MSKGLYKITILLLDEDKQLDLFDNQDILNEVERVITHEERYSLRLIKFPNGEKAIIYHTDDFLKLNEERFVEELLSHSLIVNSSNKYILLILVETEVSNHDEIIHKYNQIKQVLLDKDQDKVIPLNEPEMYSWNKGG